MDQFSGRKCHRASREFALIISTCLSLFFYCLSFISDDLFTRLQKKNLILDFKSFNVNVGILLNVYNYYEAKFIKNEVRIMTLEKSVNMKLRHLLLLWMVMDCSKAEGKE